MKPIPHAAGIILCGGRSSRMGQSKAWLEIDGESLLNRIVRILAEQLSPIAVVAAPDQQLPELSLPVRIARDAIAERGPVYGLAAGLNALAGVAEFAYVTACDVPFLQPRFVQFVVESLGDFDAAVPMIDGRAQPLAAVYRVASVLRVMPALLADNRCGLRDLFPLLATKYLKEEQLRSIDPALDSLRNANTPEEWEELCRQFAIRE